VLYEIGIGPLIVPGVGAGAGVHLIEYFSSVSDQSSFAEGVKMFSCSCRYVNQETNPYFAFFLASRIRPAIAF
jgi:hypothetical protein